MKGPPWIFFFLLSFLTSLCGPSAFLYAEDPPFLGLVTGERVSLRSSPSRSGEILLSFPRGTTLHVVEKKGVWYGVYLPPEAPAYISKDFLHVESGWGVAHRSEVHIRSGAGQAFASLGKLPQGHRVKVRRLLKDWVQIEPPPLCRGWIHSAYMTFLEPEENGGILP